LLENELLNIAPGLTNVSDDAFGTDPDALGTGAIGTGALLENELLNIAPGLTNVSDDALGADPGTTGAAPDDDPNELLNIVPGLTNVSDDPNELLNIAPGVGTIPTRLYCCIILLTKFGDV
jgi:hypothetical protein